METVAKYGRRPKAHSEGNDTNSLHHVKMSGQRRKKQRQANERQRKRRAKETAAEASQRQLQDTNRHQQSRENEDEKCHDERLESNRIRAKFCAARKYEEVVSPGRDEAVDQFCDHTEEHGAKSFQNPDAGLGVLYANNGTHLFGQNLTYQLPSPTAAEVEARITRDIQRNILDGEKAQAIADIVGQTHNLNINELPGCAVCGGRYNSANDVTMQYEDYNVADLPPYMVMEGQNLTNLLEEEQVRVTIPINEQFETEEVVPCHMRSYFRWNGLTYYLHQELVEVNDDQATIKLCPNCCHTIKGGGDKPPRNSVASGVDFGCFHQIARLKTPNIHEQAILAIDRHYHASAKMHSNLRGSASSILIFNPSIPHGCSAKLAAYENAHVNLMSMYLKSAVVGNNDNSIPMTPEARQVAERIWAAMRAAAPTRPRASRKTTVPTPTDEAVLPPLLTRSKTTMEAAKSTATASYATGAKDAEATSSDESSFYESDDEDDEDYIDPTDDRKRKAKPT